MKFKNVYVQGKECEGRPTIYKIMWDDNIAEDSFNDSDLDFLFRDDERIKQHAIRPMFSGSHHLCFDSRKEAQRFVDELLLPTLVAFNLLHTEEKSL